LAEKGRYSTNERSYPMEKITYSTNRIRYPSKKGSYYLGSRSYWYKDKIINIETGSYLVESSGGKGIPSFKKRWNP
jgi:hypothetical protein